MQLDSTDRPSLAFFAGSSNSAHLAEWDGSGWITTVVEGPAGPDGVGKGMRLALTPNDRPMLAYHDQDAQTVHFAERDAGGVWNIVEFGPIQIPRDLTTDGSGQPVLLGRDHNEINLLLYTRSAGGWDQDLSFPGTGKGYRSGQVAVDSSGALHVVATDSGGTIDYLKKIPGGWQVSTVVSGASGGIGPDIAITPQGQAVVCFVRLADQMVICATEVAAGTRTDTAIVCAPNGIVPLWSPDGAEFAYLSSTTGFRELYVVHSATCTATQITNLGGTVNQYSWSPDGTEIAFSGRRSLAGEDDLFVVDLGTGDLRQCTNTPTTTEGFNHGAWCANGFLVYGSERGSSGVFDIYTIDPADPTHCVPSPPSGHDPGTCLTCSEPGQNNYAIPSNDGTRIAWFQAPAFNADAALRIMDKDGSSKTANCAGSSQPYEFRGIAWSPDDSIIAYNVGGRRIRTMSSACSGQFTQISNVAFNEALNDFSQNQAWLPDGMGLAFHSNHEGNFDIFTMDPNGNNRNPLTADTADDRHPVVSPGGYSVAFECTVPGQDPDICLVSLDTDGDGLLDDWEVNGLDVDSDGVIDVDLPSLGADPFHKDIFLEVDWMDGEEPAQAEIQALKEAFAAAPIDVGGTPNPDGAPGINLWVDTGDLTDPLGIEDGAGSASCSDGIDNGADGTADDADPDCLVGDNLGGGNALAAVDICNLDPNFYAAKSVNFSSYRHLVFRYGLSGRGCDEDGDGRIDSGGWGEIGGNDFIEYNHDAGTIMHELGHTLNLRHGGFENANCKPNYVSVMNYDNQFGIRRARGRRIIDFSPPRFSAGRGQAPLPTLMEDSLNEAVILDGTDPANQFVFVNDRGKKVRSQLNEAVDWNGDGDTDDLDVMVNVDTSGRNGRPEACANASSDSQLPGYDDWSNVALDFRQFGDSADSAINPVTEPEPNIAELLEIEQEVNTTDLAITKTDSLDPIRASEALFYTILVDNNGPNPASDVRVLDSFPPGVSYVASTAACVEDPTGTLICDLEEILVGESRSIIVTVVVNDGTGQRLTNTATVENLAGPDSDFSNNSAQEDTQVILDVVIDIKPGSFPNSINLSSAGVIPVAILGSSTFDALMVDPDSLTLSGASVRMVGKSERLLCHDEDVNDDALVDLVCQVVTDEFMIEEGESVAVLEAETFDGIPVRGEDSVRIVPDTE